MLTPKQVKLLGFILAHHEKTGIYPSVREIARELRLASTNTVVYHLQKLEKAGCVKRSRNARSYTVLKVPEEVRQTLRRETRMRLEEKLAAKMDASVREAKIIPLEPQATRARPIPILGRVAAGQPLFAEQNFDGMLDLQMLLDTSGDVFALRVSGDSMIEDGIFDGDLVIVRAQPKVENGEIGVVVVGDEATVKRIYDDGATWRLVPANSTMEPIVIPKRKGERVRIAGKVVGVVRKIR
jgi:repressor LexA